MAQVLIVQSFENSQITNEMYLAAVEALDNSRVTYDRIEVPTVAEIPTAISMSIESSDFESVICLGCIVERDAEAFVQQTIFKTVYESLNDFGVHYIMPIGSGLLYAEFEKEAIELAPTYGKKAAEIAILMLKQKRQINLLEDDRLTLGRKHN